MLRLLVALLGLLLPAAPLVLPASHSFHAAEDAGGAASPAVFVLDHTMLPGATGWFLVPFTAPQGANATLRVEMEVVDGNDVLSAAAVVISHGEGLSFWTSLGSAPHDLRVSHGGPVVGCCPRGDTVVGSFYSWSVLEGDSQVYLEPNRTFWLGLLAADWEEDSRLLVEILPDAEVSMGQARSGAKVAYVDLAEAARASGTNVRLGGLQVGENGDASVRFEPRGTGLVALSWWALGEASARFDATLGATRLHEDAPISRNVGMISAGRAAPFEASLRDLAEPNRPYLPGEEWEHSAVGAGVLFADVDVPFDFLAAWQDDWQ